MNISDMEELIKEALFQGGLSLGKTKNTRANVGKTPALVLAELLLKLQQ